MTLARWGLLGVLAGVFAYAGALKVLDPAGFAGDIDAYRLTPHEASVLAALYLPWLELACAAGLFWRPLRLPALWILLGLLLVFGAAILSAWVRGLDIACGCFGTPSEPGEYLAPLLRDGALIAVGTTAWVLEARHRANDSDQPGPLRGTSARPRR
jgi:hypothetical protein